MALDRRAALAAGLVLLAACGPTVTTPALPTSEATSAAAPASTPRSAPTPPPGYGAAYCSAVAAFDDASASLRDWGGAVRAGDTAAAARAVTAARQSLDEMTAIADALPAWAPADTIPRRLREAADVRHRLVDDVTGGTGPLAAADRARVHAVAARSHSTIRRAAASWELIESVFGVAACPADPTMIELELVGGSGVIRVPASWAAIDLAQDPGDALALLPNDASPPGPPVRGLVAEAAGAAGNRWNVAFEAAGPPHAYLVVTSEATDDPYQALADAGESLAPIGSAATPTRSDFTVGPASAIRIDVDTVDRLSTDPATALASTVVAVTGTGAVLVAYVLSDVAAARSYVFDIDAIIFSIAER